MGVLFEGGLFEDGGLIEVIQYWIFKIIYIFYIFAFYVAGIFFSFRKKILTLLQQKKYHPPPYTLNVFCAFYALLLWWDLPCFVGGWCWKFGAVRVVLKSVESLGYD